MLSDQVKYLVVNSAPPAQPSHQVTRASPVSSGPAQLSQGNLAQHMRQPHIPPPAQPQSNYMPAQASFPPAQPQMHQSSLLQGPWFPSNIAAPQASHPAAPPPVPSQQSNLSNLNRTPPLQPQPEEWDDTYLAVLGTQDTRQLRELLARSNPDIIMPLQGGGPLSQAVVLTLVHRVSACNYLQLC